METTTAKVNELGECFTTQVSINLAVYKWLKQKFKNSNQEILDLNKVINTALMDQMKKDVCPVQDIEINKQILINKGLTESLLGICSQSLLIQKQHFVIDQKTREEISKTSKEFVKNKISELEEKALNPKTIEV
jgi:hypothetical protein